MPSILNNVTDVVRLIQQLSSGKMCVGNEDPKFDALAKSFRKGQFSSSSGIVILLNGKIIISNGIVL